MPSSAPATCRATIHINSVVDTHALTIEVIDDIAGRHVRRRRSEEARLLEEAGVDQEGLGALLMEILVDEVKIESTAERNARPADQICAGITVI